MVIVKFFKKKRKTYFFFFRDLALKDSINIAKKNQTVRTQEVVTRLDFHKKFEEDIFERLKSIFNILCDVRNSKLAQSNFKRIYSNFFFVIAFEDAKNLVTKIDPLKEWQLFQKSLPELIEPPIKTRYLHFGHPLATIHKAG